MLIITREAETWLEAPPAAAAPASKDPKTRRPKTIDKSVLALPEPRRIRGRDNVRHLAKQACLVCGRQPADAHHLRFAQSRALGRKVSDAFTVPLCRGHHREVHRCGDEAAWWRKAGIDPTVTARTLWLETHPLARTDQMGIEGATAVTTPEPPKARLIVTGGSAGEHKNTKRSQLSQLTPRPPR